MNTQHTAHDTIINYGVNVYIYAIIIDIFGNDFFTDNTY